MTSARELTTGLRLRSQVCTSEVIVVRPPQRAVELACGGVSMIAITDDRDPDAIAAGIAPGLDGGTLIGKRYTDGDETLEVLATKAGRGTLTADGATLVMKVARALPSSD